MDKIAAAAFSFAAAFAAAGFAPAAAQTAASAAVPSQAASSTGSEARIGPVAGSPDAVDVEGYTAASCVSIYSADVASVGPVLGDAEKDTVARTVVGTDCR